MKGRSESGTLRNRSLCGDLELWPQLLNDIDINHDNDIWRWRFK